VAAVKNIKNVAYLHKANNCMHRNAKKRHVFCCRKNRAPFLRPMMPSVMFVKGQYICSNNLVFDSGVTQQDNQKQQA